MGLFKTARYFKLKLAASIQDMLGKLQAAHTNASAALSKMEELDAGYSELRTVTGILYHLWKISQTKAVDNFKFKLESQLPKLKEYSNLALAQSKDSTRPYLQQLLLNVNTIVPVELQNDEENEPAIGV